MLYQRGRRDCGWRVLSRASQRHPCTRHSRLVYTTHQVTSEPVILPGRVGRRCAAPAQSSSASTASSRSRVRRSRAICSNSSLASGIDHSSPTATSPRIGASSQGTCPRPPECGHGVTPGALGPDASSWTGSTLRGARTLGGAEGWGGSSIPLAMSEDRDFPPLATIAVSHDTGDDWEVGVMKHSARLIAAALIVSLFVAVGATSTGANPSPPPPPPSPFTCAGTLSAPEAVPSGTYSSLTMPAGSICEMPGPQPVTVLSGVTLQNGSGLFTGVTHNASTVKIVGSLTLQPGSLFVAGLKSERHPVNILGNVTVGSGALFYLGTEKPGKPPFATIQGSVDAQEPSAVVIQNTAIGGPVSVMGGGAVNAIVEALSHNSPFTNYTDFEDDQINGGITEVGYNGIFGGVIRSILSGSLAFAFNNETTIDEYDIGSNIIAGSAYCAGNNPPPNMGHSTGSPSIVDGNTFGDQAATCTGVPGGGTGPPG